MSTTKRAGPGQAGSSHRYMHLNIPQRREDRRGLEYRLSWLSLQYVPGAAGSEAMRMRQRCCLAAACRLRRILFRPMLALLGLSWIIVLAAPAVAARSESF